MDIHKPKAVHNLRELATEIGIIVIGVIIALGAEQLVEAWHWRDQAEAGETSLKADFLRVVRNADELAAQEACVEARLTELSAIVEKASESGRLPPVGEPGRPPFSPWRNAVWPALEAGQVTTHMPRMKAVAYSTIVVQSDYLADLSDQELDQWQTLSTLVGPGRRMSDVEAETLRTTLAHARFSADKMFSTSQIAVARIKATNMLTEADFATAAKRAQDLRAQAKICQPIATPTA